MARICKYPCYIPSAGLTDYSIFRDIKAVSLYIFSLGWDVAVQMDFSMAKVASFCEAGGLCISVLSDNIF